MPRLLAVMSWSVASLMLAGCTGDPTPADAGMMDASIGRNDAGRSDASLDAGRSDGGFFSEAGKIEFRDAMMLPGGRVACYFGPQYNCNDPGEACCESNQRCYFPETEPDFCPD